MVAKTAVIRMLLDGHELDGVVASLFYAWKYVFSKVYERGHFWFF